MKKDKEKMINITDNRKLSRKEYSLSLVFLVDSRSLILALLLQYNNGLFIPDMQNIGYFLASTMMRSCIG